MRRVYMRLERNDEHDCYIVYPCGTLATEDDVHEWVREYEIAFDPFGRRVDIVVVLDMFNVEPQVAKYWAKQRAIMVKRYTNHTVRVSSGGWLETLMSPENIDYAPDIATALTILDAKRKAVPTTKPLKRKRGA